MCFVAQELHGVLVEVLFVFCAEHSYVVPF